jgi:hypothetical protein
MPDLIAIVLLAGLAALFALMAAAGRDWSG